MDKANGNNNIGDCSNRDELMVTGDRDEISISMAELEKEDAITVHSNDNQNRDHAIESFARPDLVDKGESHPYISCKHSI